VNIGLIDLDSNNFPNIPLMKLSTWHKKNGDNVEFADMFGVYDIIYKSKIFTWSIDPEYCYNTKEFRVGGSGYDLSIKLDNDIENIKDIDYSLYNIDYSVQLFSRGCVRQCGFCVVPEKEGSIKAIEPMKLNEKGTFIEVLDNNFFANPEWEGAIEYILQHEQPVNFHGIDVRLLNEEQCYILDNMKLKKQIKIAWDEPDDKIYEKIKEVIKYIKPWKIMCYVLIGYNTTEEEDIYRVMKLNEIKVDPFVMPYNRKDNYQKNFARYVNHKAIFNSVSWNEYQY